MLMNWMLSETLIEIKSVWARGANAGGGRREHRPDHTRPPRPVASPSVRHVRRAPHREVERRLTEQPVLAIGTTGTCARRAAPFGGHIALNHRATM